MEDIGIITADHVSRRYGGPGRAGYDAVRGVSFAVRRGELFALLGTNGAGKTSTLEVLEGLARPTAGTVRVLGCDPYRDRPRLRPRIAIMLQEGGLAGDLTVRETARMWAGTVTAPRPVGEVLELVDLAHRGRVLVKQLSGGEKRRLDLALALLGRPEVLFLDEPTTGLDPESRRRTWTLVRDLLLEGTTVVLTTHYLEEAAALADRLAILHRGRVARTGTPAEVTAASPARISFALPADDQHVVPALPAAIGGQRSGGGDVLVETRDLQQTLSALLGWADTRGVVLRDLDARSASLEEAFLAVAGAPMDDDTSEETAA